jgi:hypothetical protein
VWSFLETEFWMWCPSEKRLDANSNEGLSSIYGRRRRKSLSFDRVVFLEYSMSIVFISLANDPPLRYFQRTKLLHF